jgi:hypothetical protein
MNALQKRAVALSKETNTKLEEKLLQRHEKQAQHEKDMQPLDREIDGLRSQLAAALAML